MKILPLLQTWTLEENVEALAAQKNYITKMTPPAHDLFGMRGDML